MPEVGIVHGSTIELEKPHNEQAIGENNQDTASVVEECSPETRAALTQLKSKP